MVEFNPYPNQPRTSPVEQKLKPISLSEALTISLNAKQMESLRKMKMILE